MICRPIQVFAVVAVACGLAWTQPAAAVVPTESLLPDTTKGFLSVANLDVLKEHWDKCQLGQLTNDPLMQEFVEDFRQQILRKWHTLHQDLGLKMQDLDGVPGGEFCFAMLQPEAPKYQGSKQLSPGRYAVVILVDATGHDAQAKALVAKVTKNLTELKATRVDARQVANPDITAFNLFRRDPTDKLNRQAAFFYKNNWVCLTNDVAEAKDAYDRVVGKAIANPKRTLAALPAFANAMANCEADSVIRLKPHGRWFFEPFGYVEASRVANPPKERAKGQADMLRVLKSQGFDAVQGMGGYVNFAVEVQQHAYDVLHRTFVYAPPLTGLPNGQLYKLAAQMLAFSNGGDFGPQPWVPRDLATYTTFNWDMQKAFEASRTLVNAVVGDDVFDDMLDNFRDDPNGIHIDIRKDLIGNLGTRATILTDYQLPITTKSERMLVGINIAKNPEAVRELVRRAAENEKHNKIQFESHTIWEIINEANSKKADNIDIEIPGLGGDQVAVVAQKPKPEEEAGLPNSAVAIAYGHLFVATHVDILKKVLRQGGLGAAGEPTSLAQSADYRLVMGELARLGAKDNIQCAKLFSRTDEEYRTTYELLRTGQMPQAETMLGRFLNMALSEKEGEVRHQKIDGKNLPNYEIARRYFGPAGVAVSSKPDGWYMVGFMLAKEAPAAE